MDVFNHDHDPQAPIMLRYCFASFSNKNLRTPRRSLCLSIDILTIDSKSSFVVFDRLKREIELESHIWLEKICLVLGIRYLESDEVGYFDMVCDYYIEDLPEMS